MEISSAIKPSAEQSEADYDRAREVKAFDDSKAGVKGIVDAGVTKVPKMFIIPPEERAGDHNTCKTGVEIPVVDLDGIQLTEGRKEIVEKVLIAAETWGIFQVVNHGIPLSLMSELLDGIRKFHEQDVELKREFYTRDRTKRVYYESNYDLHQSRVANWRDSLYVSLFDDEDDFDPCEVPTVCRDTTIEYIKQATKFGETLFELLSEALGLKCDHLIAMECARGVRTFVGHYYPPCPEPELTLGGSKHTDPVFLGILLQDQIGGLQVLHEDQWINVQPIPGALVINAGDLLQMLTNDRFKSVHHRVLANRVGPRISAAFFFKGVSEPPKLYGPIEELLSEEKPPVYRKFKLSDYFETYFSKAHYEPCRDLFRI